MRGLRPTRLIDLRVISRSAVTEYLMGGFNLPERKRETDLRQEVYSLLGFIPANVNLLQIALDAYSQPFVLAFYDPDARAIFLFEEQLGSGNAFINYVLSHEFVHALQDQHYDLNAVALTFTVVGDQAHFDWDAAFAFSALVEGDARNLDTAYLRQEITGTEALSLLRSLASLPSLDPNKYPPVVIREISWPYEAGAGFLNSNTPKTQGGIAGIYAARPRTTEQIIHPEKYIAKEGARPVDLQPLTPALGPGWREIGSANFGEFAWQNYLLLGVSDGTAVSRAAAGWGGDRFTLYGLDGGARLFHSRVAWDSQAEAQEFWTTFVSSLRNRGGSLDLGEGNLTWRSGARTLRATLAGDTVTLLASNDAAGLAAASAAVGLH
jgi:hypothetical protein